MEAPRRAPAGEGPVGGEGVPGNKAFPGRDKRRSGPGGEKGRGMCSEFHLLGGTWDARGGGWQSWGWEPRWGQPVRPPARVSVPGQGLQPQLQRGNSLCRAHLLMGPQPPGMRQQVAAWKGQGGVGTCAGVKDSPGRSPPPPRPPVRVGLTAPSWPLLQSSQDEPRGYR